MLGGATPGMGTVLGRGFLRALLQIGFALAALGIFFWRVDAGAVVRLRIASLAPAGITAQLWTQDSASVPGRAEAGDASPTPTATGRAAARARRLIERRVLRRALRLVLELELVFMAGVLLGLFLVGTPVLTGHRNAS